MKRFIDTMLDTATVVCVVVGTVLMVGGVVYLIADTASKVYG